MNLYLELSPEFRGVVDEYLESVSADAVHGYRPLCCRFLLYLRHSGIQTVSEIKIPDIISAMNKIMQSQNKHASESWLSCVKRFLFFEEGKGLIPASLPLMMKYYPRNQVLFLDDFSDEERTKIIDSQKTIELDVEEYHRCCEKIIQTMESMRYEHWHIVNLKKLADLHYLFLSVSSLSYNEETYLIWREKFIAKIMHGASVVQDTTKLLFFVKQWQTFGRIIPEKYYRQKIVPYDTLPGWCKETLDAFLELKRKEGWKHNTIQMYRSSVTRFCVFLVEKGHGSFAELTPEIVKQFNLEDKHKTPEGKNAYNSRIRRFLDYLGEKHIVESRLLFLALPCVAAPSTRIVVTLTDEEDKELERLILSDDSPLTLREKTMLALGRYLGMRESDVIGLCGANIDLKNRIISFVQKKTECENIIPFSVKIGNLLYRYVTEERPDTDDPHIFVRKCAPHTKLRDSSPCDAFTKAFPERDVPGSNFHTLRKTFSSNMLKSGVKVSTIADIDGHRGMDSIHIYLSTDGERMRQCTRSLLDSEITMKEVFPS